MYKQPYMKLENLVRDKEKLWAHTKEDKVPELLEEHLERAIYYFEWLCDVKKLDIIIGSFRKKFADCRVFEKLLKDMIYLHDIGKINVDFQNKQLNNNVGNGKIKGEGRHSLLSAYIYMDYSYHSLIELGITDERECSYALILIYLNSYVISRHHSPLSSFKEFNSKLIEFIEGYKLGEQVQSTAKIQLTQYLAWPLTLEKEYVGNLIGVVEETIQKSFSGWESSILMIYTRWIYSLLVACDFYATSEYMTSEKIDNIGMIQDINSWNQAYRERPVYKAIQAYSRDRLPFEKMNNINHLRSEMFLEATQELQANNSEWIYYLEAPTGSGKTNTSIQLMLQLMQVEEERRKVYYVFPFNTLAEQTHQTLMDIFGQNQEINREIAVINGITEYKVKDELEQYDRLDYDKILLDRQFGHYGLTLTSHVQFFMWLFESGRENAGALYQMANSVVILDEIQAYKNTLWTEIIGFLNQYAKLLNMKVIIMSATLPPIGALIDGMSDIPRLLPRAKQYFNHPLFKERVMLDFSLLKEEEPVEVMIQHIEAYEEQVNYRILIEFITKASAMTFYQRLCELQEEGIIEKQVYLVTGDDSRSAREKVIHRIKKAQEDREGIIVVATQLIEAGVDIDMNIGFKDISILDSEEQFLGRINRSCKEKGAKAYFFDLDKANIIYKNDYRKNKVYTLLEEVNQKILINKDFGLFYESILQDVKQHGEKANTANIADFLTEQVRGADTKAIASHMKLIDEDIYPVSVFINHDADCEWDGEKVWNEYVELLTDDKLSYAEKKFRMAKLSEPMSCFIWKVKRENGLSYTAQMGDLLYIEDGDRYFVNGKLDRKMLCGDTFELL